MIVFRKIMNVLNKVSTVLFIINLAVKIFTIINNEVEIKYGDKDKVITEDENIQENN